MNGLAVFFLAALCLFAADARANIVDQYKLASDTWRKIEADRNPGNAIDYCSIARSYDEMRADIDVALLKDQLLLVKPNVRFIDLTDEDRRDLRAFYSSLETAYRDADGRCQR